MRKIVIYVLLVTGISAVSFIAGAAIPWPEKCASLRVYLINNSGAISTLCGATIGVFGAYIVATKQKRDDIRDREKRFNVLLKKIFSDLASVCDRFGPKEPSPKEMDIIKGLLETYKRMPLSSVPVQYLEHYGVIYDELSQAWLHLDNCCRGMQERQLSAPGIEDIYRRVADIKSNIIELKKGLSLK